MTRDEILEGADEEASFNVAASALEGKEEITLEDLRTLPGVTEEMSDDDVLNTWKEVQAGSAEGNAAIADAAGAESAVKTSRGYKLYDENGQEIGDISKLSAQKLLGSKIGYTANKTEHRKSMEELIRVAQFGHLNETKLSAAERERDAALDKLTKSEPQLAEAMRANGAVRYAMTQFVIGNEEPMKSLISAFQKQMGGMPGVQQPVQAQAQSAQPEAQAIRTYYEEILPSAYAVADRYGAKHNEMKAAVDGFLNNTRTVTREKLTQYIEEEIPLLLESQGYSVRHTPAPVSTDPRDAKIAELEARLAGKGKVDQVRQIQSQNKKLPNSASRDSMSAGQADGATVPAEAIKDRRAFKKFLES